LATTQPRTGYEVVKMNLEDIRTASAEEFASQRQAAAKSNETTPPGITPAILAFVGEFSDEAPVFVPVVDDQHGLYGWCSDGVAEKVKADGGIPLFGWTIWDWPGVMLTAEYHCVWRDANGEVLDITPKPKGESRILFVPEPHVPVDFDFDQRPTNRRIRNYEPRVDSRSARGEAITLSGGKRAYEERRAAKAGLELHAWLQAKEPIDPVPDAIDELIAACHAHEVHFDTLGASGPVAVDAELITHMRRRLAAQTNLKALLVAGRR
jgi:hypothetical protein